MKHTFNTDNPQNNRQPTALAIALSAYAENVDDPFVLLPTLMAGIEANLYAAQVTKTGNWTGWRPFEVKTKIEEPTKITSFHLYPSDGGPVADYRLGQYISVRVFMPHLNLLQSSQYTITNSPNGLYYCISVKRNAVQGHSSSGISSNRFCKVVQVGDRLDVMAPTGICSMTTQTEKSGLGKTHVWTVNAQDTLAETLVIFPGARTSSVKPVYRVFQKRIGPNYQFGRIDSPS